jgi:hypothetical protein
MTKNLSDKHDLADLLRDIARKGQLNHITIGHTMQGGKPGYQIGFRDQTSSGYAIALNPDPVEGLIEAILQRSYAQYPGSKTPPPNVKRQEPIKKKNRDLL